METMYTIKLLDCTGKTPESFFRKLEDLLSEGFKVEEINDYDGGFGSDIIKLSKK